MKRYLAFTTCYILCTFIYAQRPFAGIPYQAVARDPMGSPIREKSVSIKIVLSGPPPHDAEYYSEIHNTATDKSGLFSITVGEGIPIKGSLENIPWGNTAIWQVISIELHGEKTYRLQNASRLPSVPYAIHALSTSRLLESKEKSQSIYWSTSGNSLTLPPTHVVGNRDSVDLKIKTNGKTRMVITKEGQIQIEADEAMADKPDDEIDSYPVSVEGGDHGVYIKVEGQRSKKNNFVNFGDDSELTWGAIEGQSTPELESELGGEKVFRYVSYILYVPLRLIGLYAQVTAEFASGLGAAKAAGTLMDAVALGIDLANLIQESETNQTNKMAEVGVTYSTGAADYAEWLERAPGVRKLLPGQVVGVKFGKVSLQTKGADRCMVVSSNPAVLGNTPPDQAKDRYEKIAFMGQVPVRVLGTVSSGDYILPSGNQDGLAIAVHPDKMLPGDYAHIIGVAWENGQKDLPIHLINTAVGINGNDLAREVLELETQVAAIMDFLNKKSPSFYVDGHVLPKPPTTSVSAADYPVLSDAQFDAILDQHADFLRDVLQTTKIELDKRNLLIASESPLMKSFFEDPIPVIKKLRRDFSLAAIWNDKSNIGK